MLFCCSIFYYKREYEDWAVATDVMRNFPDMRRFNSLIQIWSIIEKELCKRLFEYLLDLVFTGNKFK